MNNTQSNCEKCGVNTQIARNVKNAQLTMAEQVGERIAQERRLKGVRDRCDVDQKLVAEAMAVDPATVSRWEAGQSMPRDTMLFKLAEYFGVTPAWLRYGQSPREAEGPAKTLELLPDPTKDRKLSEGELGRAERTAERQDRESAQRAQQAAKKRPKGGRA